MDKPNENHSSSGGGFEHAALVEKLLSEAYAIENRLGDVTLEQVGEQLEYAKQSFDAQPSPLPTLQQALKESFERCHSIYCELLFELDMAPSPEALNKSLWDLAQHEKQTQMISLPDEKSVEALWNEESAPAQAVSDDPTPASQDLPLPEPLWPEVSDSPEERGETPAPELEEPMPDAFPPDDSLPSEGELKLEAEFEAPEPLGGGLSSIEAGTPKWEEQEEVKLEEQTKSFAMKIAPPSPDEVEPTESSAPEPMPTFEEEEKSLPEMLADQDARENKTLDELFAEAERSRVQVHSKIAELPKEPAFEPEPPLQGLEPSLTDNGPVVSSETSYNAVTAREIPPEETKPHYNDFWTMAEWFGKPEVPLPAPISKLARKRMATLLQALSVEHQLANVMHKTYHQAWASRRDWLRLLAKGPLPLKEIPAEIKAAVNALAIEKIDLVYEKRFPHPGIVSAINYFLECEFEKLRPTLLDHGTLILFFGQHKAWGGNPFPNVLSLTGLDEQETLELSFRLFRLQKLRNKALAMGEPFENETFDLALADAERIQALLAKVSIQESVEQQVA